MFDNPAFDAHERVVFADDEQSGLRAIVAVHSTRRGPGAGGCRFWQYRSSAEALTDALRLSRGMSYKNAMAELPLGGGKAVVMMDARHPKSPRLLEAFGRLVDSLEGRYITAEDVGATVSDMEVVATQTPYVSGLPRTAAFQPRTVRRPALLRGAARLEGHPPRPRPAQLGHPGHARGVRRHHVWTVRLPHPGQPGADDRAADPVPGGEP